MNEIIKYTREVNKYIEYIKYRIKSDIKRSSIGSYLGYLWWLLDPLMYMLVYVLVVSVIFQRGGENFPVFVFSALLIWKWVSQSLIKCTNVIKSNSSITSNVYLPKAILPLIQVLIGFVYYFFGLLILMIIIPIFGIDYSLYMIQIIPVLIVTFIMTLSLGMLIAHLGVYFKDVNNIMLFTVRLWFYLSPILYSVDDIPEKYRAIWWLNPMTTIFTSIRNALLYQGNILFKELLVIFIGSLMLLCYSIKKMRLFDKIYAKIS